MYRGQPDPYLILGPQPALTLDPPTVVISSLFANTYSMHLYLFLASFAHELCYPQCVGAGFSSSYLPYSFDHPLALFASLSSEGMTSLYSVPIIRSHKTCPPLKAFTIQPMLPHVQHPPPICRQFNSAVANVCIDLFWPRITKFYLVTLPLNTLLFCCQQPDTDPNIPVLIMSLSIKHSISGSCRLTDVPDFGVQ